MKADARENMFIKMYKFQNHQLVSLIMRVKKKLCVPEINNNGDNAYFHCPKLDLSGLGTQSLPS